MEDRATGLRPAPPAGKRLVVPADELARLERELLADPCNLVRRACQLADYGTIAPGGEPDEPQGR